jgi:hypothetical protein
MKCYIPEEAINRLRTRFVLFDCEGKPRSTARLKIDLEAYVAEENYETAAIIRDEINRREKNIRK